MAWLISALTVYSIVQLGLGLGDTEQFYFEIPAAVERLLMVILVSTFGSLAVIAALANQILQGNGSSMERVNFATFSVNCLLFAWLGWHWNILNWYL